MFGYVDGFDGGIWVQEFTVFSKCKSNKKTDGYGFFGLAAFVICPLRQLTGLMRENLEMYYFMKKAHVHAFTLFQILKFSNYLYAPCHPDPPRRRRDLFCAAKSNFQILKLPHSQISVSTVIPALLPVLPPLLHRKFRPTHFVFGSCKRF